MKKQAKTLVQLMLFLFLGTNINAQEFKWANRAGLWGYDYGYGVCSDDLGNVYVAGKYEMDAIFDDITSTCEGNHDIFTAKYNPEGKVLWVRTAGGLYGDYAHAITCDGAGNTYLTGEIDGAVSFKGSEVKLNAWGKNDIFVSKYNTEGVLQWAHRGGGKLSDKGQSIAISKDAVYVTGYFRDTALFNNDGAFKVYTAGEKDAFIAKYDLNGILVWLKRAGSTGDDEGSGITVDADGFVYVAGHIDGDGDFDGTPVKTNGGRDAYLAKLDPSGKLIWFKNVGGSRSDIAFAVNASKDGRIYMTGEFSGTGKFGSTSLASKGGRDIFVACFTNDGNVVWAKRAGGTEQDAGLGISNDEQSNVYVTGFYAFSADFDDQKVTGVDSSEIFVAKYDSTGQFKWVIQVGGTVDSKFEAEHEEAGRAIFVDKRNFVLITGSFWNDANLGPNSLIGWTNTDIFVAKIKQTESDETPYDTGVPLLANNDNFKVYPVPADEEININYSGNALKNVTIKLESLEGRTLFYKSYKNYFKGNEIIRIDEFAKGIYFLQISTENSSFVHKIIKK